MYKRFFILDLISFIFLIVSKIEKVSNLLHLKEQISVQMVKGRMCLYNNTDTLRCIFKTEYDVGAESITIDVCGGITQHGYMTNYFFSHRNIEVNDSMILELTSRMLDDKPAENHLACDVNIVTLPSRRILIHFLSLEISYDEKEVDRLHVYDYMKNGADVRLTPSQGLYGLFDSHYHGINGRLDDYQSTGNRLKLDYQGKPTLAYDGFKILITSFRDSRGDCGRGYLRCVRKNICIPVSLWCDGYQNCGNDDNSDEVNCNLNMEPEWKPIDGTLAAVLASGISSLVFLISLAILAYVVLKISKRQHIITNVVVEYKKRKSPKRQISNGEMLTRLYAPPSYEVVIGMDEDPPPYQMVTAVVDSESDEEDGVLREQTVHDYETLSAVQRLKENVYNSDIENLPSCSNTEPSLSNCTVVSCDVHGSDVKLPKIESSDTGSIQEDSNDAQSDFLAQTNYKLCSTTEPNGSLARHSVEPEIEILASDDSDSSKDSNRNSKRKCNGNLAKIHNGENVNYNQQNGHAQIYLDRLLSKRSDSIEYFDSD